jgi:hypothetical protein
MTTKPTAFNIASNCEEPLSLGTKEFGHGHKNMGLLNRQQDIKDVGAKNRIESASWNGRGKMWIIARDIYPGLLKKTNVRSLSAPEIQNTSRDQAVPK